MKPQHVNFPISPPSSVAVILETDAKSPSRSVICPRGPVRSLVLHLDVAGRGAGGFKGVPFTLGLSWVGFHRMPSQFSLGVDESRGLWLLALRPSLSSPVCSAWTPSWGGGTGVPAPPFHPAPRTQWHCLGPCLPAQVPLPRLPCFSPTAGGCAGDRQV